MVGGFNIITSNPTPQQRAKWAEDPGKPESRINGGYLDDLAALGKAFWFCAQGCASKFAASETARRYCYHAPRDLAPAIGAPCDGCRQHGNVMRVFIPRDRSFL